MCRATCGRVLLTGASGLVGRATLRRLSRDGFSVRVLEHSAPVPEAPERIRGDLLDRDALARAVSGCDAVVHCAGRLAGTADQLAKLHVEGTSRLCEAAAAAGIARFVMVGTTAVYSPGELRDADEDTEAAPDDPYAASKLAAERRARAVLGGRLTVLRAVTVYASQPSPFVELLCDVVRSRPVPRIDAGDAPVDLVHTDDLAAALSAAARGRGAGGCFNIAGSPRAHLNELVELAADVLGVAPRWTPAARPGRPPVAAEYGPDHFDAAVYRVATVHRSVSIDRARARLGFEPRRDWRRELGAALRSLSAR